MLGLLAAVLVASTFAAAGPHNDWSQACFHGECAYELAEHTESSGVIKLLGSPSSITDITPAAGWVILDCHPQAMVQEIRLVCKSDDAQEAGCNHLFDHGGPLDKLVRLPESCGAGPFARIASVNMASDQSIPGHMAHKIVRRGAVMPLVHVVNIDTNFAAVDVEKRGAVRFRFVGLNVPNHPIDANFDWDEGLFDWFNNAVAWVKQAVVTVGNAISNAWEDVKKVAKTVGDAVGKAAVDAWHAIENIPGYIRNATHFRFDEKLIEASANLKGSAQLLNLEEKSCKLNAHLKVDVSGTGKAKVALGAVIDGSVIPPTINEFGVFSSLNVDVEGKLHIDAGLTGGLDSGRKAVIDPIGIPGMSVPGLFAIGPWVELEAQAKAALDIKLDIEVGLSYKIDNLQLWYPPKLGDSNQRKVATKESPLKLSAAANVKGYGLIEGHVIPSVKIGFVFGNKKLSKGDKPASAEASVFLEADAYARLTLEAEAHVSAQTKIRKREENAINAASTGKELAIVERSYIPPYNLRARDIEAKPSKPAKSSKAVKPSTNAKAAGGAQTSVTAGFSGCVWLDVGISLNGGAQGKFLGWKGEFSGTIWKPAAPLTIFSKCWNVGSVPSPVSPWDSRSRQLGFDAKTKLNKATCPASAEKVSKVAEEKVISKSVV